MKELNLQDVFAFARIINAAEIKEEVTKIAKKAESGEQQEAWDIGFNLIYSCIMNLSGKEGERLVFEFLAGAFEMTFEDVRSLGLKSLKEKIIELVRENDLKDFFDFAKKSAGLAK